MIFRNIFIILLSAAFFYSCAPKPYASTNKMYYAKARNMAKVISSKPVDTLRADSIFYPVNWAGTTNFGMRKPNFVIIHHTAQNSCEETIRTFTLERTQVSAHYVICKDGTLHHMLNDYLRAWHAGNARWGNLTDINSSSIGIEIDNNGKDTFTSAQINSLTILLGALKKAHNIPSANFIGHGDIAPGRKVDPNINFPWQKLADEGFGLWYGDTSGINLPAGFNSVYALRIIGYDISKPVIAAEAFRRHFIKEDRTGELNLNEQKVLYVLMQKYL